MEEVKGSEAPKEEKRLTEKELAILRKRRNDYKKNLKDSVELLELEIKFLRYSIDKPRLEYELYKMEHPEEFQEQGKVLKLDTEEKKIRGKKVEKVEAKEEAKVD